VQEEFTGKQLPATLEDSLPPNLQELFDRVRTGVRRSAEHYINLCTYAERLAKRHEGLGAESARMSAALRTLADVAADTYAADPGDILPLNMGVSAASKHYAQAQALLDDEARAWDEGALEDLKRQRDAMVSVREMFERRDRYDRDNIPFLEKRIRTNEEKLGAIRARPDGNVKPGEAEKLEDAILRVSAFTFLKLC
jgi:sorting nexin-8